MKLLSGKLCCRAVTVLVLVTFYDPNLACAQSCIHGSVRLVGSDSNAGRLEICMNGEWGTVCDDKWGPSESKVVCRQLQYPVDEPGIEQGASHKCCAEYGAGTGTIFLDDVKCTGEELSLLDCNSAERVDCSHNEDVGVICPSMCPESSIQLTNGLTPYEGIVEVCVNGAWRGVCDSKWDYKDAFVACRQLGYPATGAIPYHDSIIESHPRPNITELLCKGNESKLTDCKHSMTPTCGASNTAAVYCKGENATEGHCNEGALKLAGGSTNNEGRVEICSNGIWGTICDANKWDSRDATVVCKQLGYKNPRVYVFAHDTSSYFGIRSGVVLLSSIDCTGTELALHACKSSSYEPHHCSHDTDVGVRCEETDHSDPANCTDGDIQLIGGDNSIEGVIEICMNGTWGSVCNDGWGAQETAVVCKQLGLQIAGSSNYTSQFVGGSGPYHLDNVRCDGDEANLLECSHNGVGVHNCAPGKNAGVRCDAQLCTHGEIRLVGGANMYEGRLEVCANQHWATVCDNGFTHVAASVVCRQLFGLKHGSVHDCCGNYFGSGSSGVIINDLTCDGSENRLVDCTHTIADDFHAAGCYHRDDIVIRCYHESNCTDGDVRLADGRTEMKGRVEICIKGVWGAVTDTDWDYKAASVVCRQFQLPSEWSIPLTSPSSYFGRGAAPVLTISMLCYGDETSINDCSYASISPETLSYWHYSVAGVICQGNTTTQECTSGESRLVGGATKYEGRVEVCVDGFWGTACYNEWDQEDAIVLCRQIGLPTAGATLLPGGFFGEGTGPIFGFDCSSREPKISDCERTVGIPNCHHGLDAGVKCQAPYEYVVTVTTTPLQGPFSIGSTVMLHCSTNAPPSECVTYTWQSSIPNPQLTSTSDTSPNATVLITAGHPQVGHYFCYIYRCGSSAVLGIGSTALEIHGFLKPTRGEVLQYIPPQRVTFSIAVGTAEVQCQFRDLRWYHNGVEIIPSSRIILSDDNTTLTIDTTSEADCGTYEVKYTGLVVHPYFRSCEVAVLNLLREYPVLMPAVFHLQTSNTDKSEVYSAEQSTSISFVGGVNLETVPFSDSGEITLDVNGKVDTSLEETVFTVWHHNGGALPFGSKVGTLKKPLLHVSQSLETKKLNKIIDSGVYEVSLSVDAHSHFVSHLQCPIEYAEFVHNIFLSDTITLAKDFVHLAYYEPPEVVLEADKETLAADNIATLTCSAHGGYPAIHTISIVKDEHVIAASSTESSLTVSTETVPGAAYGLYSCIVNNTVVTEQHTVLLQERGSIVVEAMFVESGNCKEWSEFSLQESIRDMTEILLPVIKEECNCDFSISNFKDSTNICDESGEVLTFDITVVYSTEDGAVTATSINELVQNWVIHRDKTTMLTLSGETAQLKSPSCQQEFIQSDQNVEVSWGIIAGLLFGGVLFGVLLILIPLIIACAILKKGRESNKLV